MNRPRILGTLVAALLLSGSAFAFKLPPGSDAPEGDDGDTELEETGSGDTASDETASGDTASEETGAGDTASGDTASGDTALDETASGDTASEETGAGDTASDDTAAGDTASGDTASEETGAGDTASGDTASGDTASGDTAPVNHPNFLVIVGDDIGIDKVGIYAREYPSYIASASQVPATPNIDQIAQSGLRFTHAWSNPLCTPTRSALQTGRYPFRTGTGSPWPSMPELASGELTLAELLAAGHADGTTWATGLFGKWHLGGTGVNGRTDWSASRDGTVRDYDDEPNPVLQGYGTFDGFLLGTLEDYFAWTRVQSHDGGHSSVWTENEFATDVTAAAAEDWIHEQEGPWLAVVSFNAPHADGTSEGWEENDVQGSCAALAAHSDTDLQPAVYRSLVECMDTRIGELLHDIPADVLANTWIVFMGDNGTPQFAQQGDFGNLHGHTSQGKGTAYESGIQVPFVIADGADWAAWDACPAGMRSAGHCVLPERQVVHPGRAVDALVQTTDLYATVAELADLDGSGGTDSVSFTGCFDRFSRDCSTGPDGRPRVVYAEEFLCEGAANPCTPEELMLGTYAVRVGRYKLVGTYDSTRACMAQALYDLPKDPWEQSDARSRAPFVLAQLQLELRRLNPGWMDGLASCD